MQSAAGAAATLHTDKVGLTLAQAVQAMVRDAMLAEDAGRVEEGVERPAAAGASLQPRLEQLTARLARAEAEARELGELQARAEAELRELEASRMRASSCSTVLLTTSTRARPWALCHKRINCFPR